MRRILTTHAGSLPRPATLEDVLLTSSPAEADASVQEQVRQAVTDVVVRQVETGLDIVNDGEMGKVSYATYVLQRLSGFNGDDAGEFPASERQDFPEFAARRASGPSRFRVRRPACNGPVVLRDRQSVHTDIQNLRQAVNALPNAGAFISAASPGVIALFFPNAYYPTYEHYLEAIVNAMRPEYEAIADAGFVVQLDCPDLAGARHMAMHADLSTSEFLAFAQQNVEALNAATSRIAPERLRIHVCWGNYEGPHNRDVPLRDIIGVLLKARARAISLEGANPRHEHEWAVFEDVRLPPDKVLIPGVIDSTTNFIEHPDLVAQRLTRYASVVDPEQLIAGVDCGFASAAGWSVVDARIAWTKLAALAEGARTASRHVFG